MLISKLKDWTRIGQKRSNIIDISALTSTLNSGLLLTLENAFSERQNNLENSALRISDVDQVVELYAKRNMILAAASSIVPGPLGILGAIPELILNFGNQMNMIYDLGCAHDKESFVNKDLLMDIPFAAFGGNTNLALLQNSASDLVDSSDEIIKEKVKSLGNSIIEKNLKKSIVQFIPISGPILMGVWAKMTTNKIAGVSNSFFDNQTEYKEHFTKNETPKIRAELQIQKIKGLANLIESNFEINEAQIEFIAPIIENADVPQDQKNYLLEESLRTGSNFQLDYGLLKDYEEDENLIMEMVVMAKRSGSVDRLERLMIYQVAKELGHSHHYVDGLLE